MKLKQVKQKSRLHYLICYVESLAYQARIKNIMLQRQIAQYIRTKLSPANYTVQSYRLDAVGNIVSILLMDNADINYYICLPIDRKTYTIIADIACSKLNRLLNEVLENT